MQRQPVVLNNDSSMHSIGEGMKMDYESGETIDVQVHSVGIASPLNRVDLQLKRGSAVPVHNLQIGIPLS